MKNLTVQDIETVSGGEVTWEFDVGFFSMQGDGGDLAAGYDWCVSQVSDFFTWWDPAGYYGPVSC
jgi:hypothetical protein